MEDRFFFFLFLFHFLFISSSFSPSSPHPSNPSPTISPPLPSPLLIILLLLLFLLLIPLFLLLLLLCLGPFWGHGLPCRCFGTVEFFRVQDTVLTRNPQHGGAGYLSLSDMLLETCSVPLVQWTTVWDTPIGHPFDGTYCVYGANQ
jgi:hypothetical protein